MDNLINLYLDIWLKIKTVTCISNYADRLHRLWLCYCARQINRKQSLFDQYYSITSFIYIDINRNVGVLDWWGWKNRMTTQNWQMWNAKKNIIVWSCKYYIPCRLWYQITLARTSGSPRSHHSSKESVEVKDWLHRLLAQTRMPWRKHYKLH